MAQVSFQIIWVNFKIVLPHLTWIEISDSIIKSTTFDFEVSLRLGERIYSC